MPGCKERSFMSGEESKSRSGNELKNNWVFIMDKYIDGPKNLSNWGSGFHTIWKFKRLEHLVDYFTRVPLVDGLLYGSSIFLFREGVEPKWEDTSNEHGTELSISSTAGSKELSDLTFRLIVACVGSIYKWTKYVTGISIIKKSSGGDMNCKVAIWFRNQPNIDIAQVISSDIYKFLNIDENSSMSISTKVLKTSNTGKYANRHTNSGKFTNNPRGSNSFKASYGGKQKGGGYQTHGGSGKTDLNGSINYSHFTNYQDIGIHNIKGRTLK